MKLPRQLTSKLLLQITTPKWPNLKIAQTFINEVMNTLNHNDCSTIAARIKTGKTTIELFFHTPENLDAIIPALVAAA